MEDIELIPDIINNPDKISISPSKTRGLHRDALIYEKKIGNYYYYVESINKNKGTLETQTMYINK
nr:MAG TPA: nuclease [Caudoviricetes sp.]